MDYRSLIRDIPDYPKPGIVFKDLTGIWKDPVAHRASARDIADHFRESGTPRWPLPGAGVHTDPGTPSWAGSCLSAPGNSLETISESYELRRTDPRDASSVTPGDRVLLVDDLVATGGTLAAIVRMIRRQGGEAVGVGTLVSLDFLKPGDKLDIPVFALVRY